MLEHIKGLFSIDFINLLLVLLFSLIIGLEQRKKFDEKDYVSQFGTDRTFTLIGLLGYIFFVLDHKSLIPFIIGGCLLALLLAVYYYQKIKILGKYGLTSVLVALITYSLTPLIYTQPNWLVLSIVVTILILVESKDTLFNFSKKFNNEDFITLSKFIVIAGVILPILPTQKINDEIPISPYHFWLSIVVVSGISYLSYILKKFVFPNAGILLTGLLGGMYSSTATTVILSKQSQKGVSFQIVPSILLATTMMYLRILVLAFVFNSNVAYKLLPYFLGLIVLSISLVFITNLKEKKDFNSNGESGVDSGEQNPLELKTAFIFSVLFVFFAFITNWVSSGFGGQGLKLLSMIVGVTDIDPFILNLLQGRFILDNTNLIVHLIIIATTSNNIIKLLYSLIWSNKNVKKKITLPFIILISTGLFLGFIF